MEGRPECESGRGRSMGRLRYPGCESGKKHGKVEIPGRKACESGRGRSMGRLRYLYGRKA